MKTFFFTLFTVCYVLGTNVLTDGTGLSSLSQRLLKIQASLQMTEK